MSTSLHFVSPGHMNSLQHLYELVTQKLQFRGCATEADRAGSGGICLVITLPSPSWVNGLVVVREHLSLELVQ